MATQELGGHTFPHIQCKYYTNEYSIGFRLVSQSKGDTFRRSMLDFHILVFMLEGKILFSYDEYINRYMRKGDLFFVPHAAEIYEEALEDSRMLVLTFNLHLDLLCEACSLTNYVKQRSWSDYDFAPVPMVGLIKDFALSMEKYIQADMCCAFLHQSKQRELFVLLQYCYTEEQVLNLFYPALGERSFKSWVLDNYKQGMSITELAKRRNMTHRTFARRFKEKFGETPRDWILKQKAKQILLRLSIPETTVNDVIMEFDFANQTYFYTFCKKQYGCTVTELLHKMQEEKGKRAKDCQVTE